MSDGPRRRENDRLKQITITPPARDWDRISARLDSHPEHNVRAIQARNGYTPAGELVDTRRRWEVAG